MRIDYEVSMDEVKQRAKRNKLIRYGANTMWWGMDDAPWYSTDSVGLPCDPRGGMLMQTEDALGFLKAAEENPQHYGKHGLRAFLLSLHGCVVTEDGKPTCFDTWQAYNDLIDAETARAFIRCIW
jgi:hypothetical protein